MSKKWHVYIIQTVKGNLYTGITVDLQRRFEEHKAGKGAKYFRRDKPKKIVFSETLNSRSEATKKEIEIKNLKRNEKLNLIKEAMH